MDADQARAWVEGIAAAVRERADELTQLDAAIGDGDHGVNLRRGFDAVTEALAGAELPTAGDVLVKTGMTLVSKVGGASGPLYGQAFRAMGKALQQDATLAEALRAALEAVQKLGKAVPGDKTLVDVLVPAVESFEATGDFAAAARAADDGLRATVPLQARKGRASYLGERSIGHQDPGATSMSLVFAALAATAPDPGR
ncbi:dihydroxyacetone kinase subunit DhaL [Dactylosporangium sp. AC04546]|uniref:dihydroxyacetone kinase subunit DhaL n=1 Tax=Dactylosporangium sp. AC04546 TaxID=2862460 RepID=UPI001EE0BFA8|nr:dihydroxyacetone kinase subunit DhaL [Dactylosporangium sp. AC04546]WVK85351.1 dihydroxyacetone kinase subunit DhaL [Dactylosporangium sp. AC04546]